MATDEFENELIDQLRTAHARIEELESQRKLYHFDADGIALGACVVVIAESVSEAYELARKWCDDNSVNRESLKVRRSLPFSGSMVVHGWNGDY